MRPTYVSIFPEAFVPLPSLRSLNLYNNFKLFQVNPSNIIMPRRSSSFFSDLIIQFDLQSLNLGDNLLTEVPFNQLQEVNETLAILHLNNNVFIELGMSIFVLGGKETFPKMERLETLVLDGCKIQNIHNDAFLNLPNLRELSLKENPLFSISNAVVLPRLHTLHFRCLAEMFSEGEKFEIPEGVFSEDMDSLSILTIAKCSLETLVSDMFLGLENLTTFVLDECDIEGIEEGAFSNLQSVTNLSLASCSGITELPPSAMRGPQNLEVVDLSGIQIFPDDLGHILTAPPEEGDFPMAGTKVLNLTGSLINMEDPLVYMALSEMPDLEVLDMSGNRMTSWSVRQFAENKLLNTLIIRSNHDYINITEAMISDFQNLTLLDLRMNQFICNEGVNMFLNMAMENTENNLTVEGFYKGFGYVCKGKDGEKKSFCEYVDTMANNDQETTTPTVIMEEVDYLKLISPILASVILVPTLIIMANRIYSNRWYFQYKMAKRQVQKQQRNNNSSGKKSRLAYDAFVSYNAEDREFVQSVLMPGMEEERPNLRLCVHERDFEVGKSIFENIVESLEASRACVIVLSKEYAKSEWCRFEAQMALQLFQVYYMNYYVPAQVTSTASLIDKLSRKIKCKFRQFYFIFEQQFYIAL